VRREKSFAICISSYRWVNRNRYYIGSTLNKRVFRLKIDCYPTVTSGRKAVISKG